MFHSLLSFQQKSDRTCKQKKDAGEDQFPISKLICPLRPGVRVRFRTALAGGPFFFSAKLTDKSLPVCFLLSLPGVLHRGREEHACTLRTLQPT